MRGLRSFVATLYIAALLLAPTLAHASAGRARNTQRAPRHPRALAPASIRPSLDTASPDTPSRALRDVGAPHPAGFTRVLRIASAPNPRHPEVLVHAPPGFDPHGPLHLVVFLHGWLGCVDVVAQGLDAPCRERGPARHAMDLIAQFDRAHVNALLLVPQLAFDTRSSSPGRLDQPGYFHAMIEDVLAHPDLAIVLHGAAHAANAWDDAPDVVLVAHSGAYLAAADVLQLGGVDVRQVLLLDALYQRDALFERWALGHLDGFGAESVGDARRLFVMFTPPSNSGWRCRALVNRLSHAMPAERRRDAALIAPTAEDVDASLFDHALVSVGTRVRHGELPRTFLAPLLSSAGLPPLHDISVATAHGVANGADSPDAHPVDAPH